MSADVPEDLLESFECEVCGPGGGEVECTYCGKWICPNCSELLAPMSDCCYVCDECER